MKLAVLLFYQGGIMYRFIGPDIVYHGEQSREGLVGSIAWENPPYGAGNAKYVYFKPLAWNGSVAITRWDQLVAC